MVFRIIVVSSFLLLILSAVAIASPLGISKYLSYCHDLMQQRKYNIAELVLNEGIVKYPTSFDLYYQRAKVRGDFLGKFAFALTDYSVVIRYKPQKYPKAFYRRGDIFFKFKQYENAIKDYTSCLKHFPKYSKVYFKRAIAYLKLGRVTESNLDLRKCVKFSPKYRNTVNSFRKENNLSP